MTSAEAMTVRQKFLALLTLVIALVLEIVDLTIVNTALPAIKASIGADASASQWIVAGYSLAFALLLMAGGRMGDSFGYRRLFLIGVAGFTVSSVLCGLAQSGEQLVTARLLQGATGALMAPQSMALLQVLFDPLERVSKLALFGVIGGLASIAGPIIGGLLIKADLFGLGWRLVFLINVPVGILAMAMARAYLPATRSDRHSGYDSPGMVLFGAAVAALLWPLIGAEGEQADPAAFLVLLACPPLAWLGWRHVAARTRAGMPALFDPAIFAIPTYRLGLAMSVAFGAASAGFLLVFAFALQAQRGQTPLVTGLLHMPFGFGAMFGIGVLSRKLLPALGKWLPLGGALLMAASATLVLVATARPDWPLWTIAPAMVAAGIGMGMTTGCIGPITFAQMDRAHAGAASGLMKTCQQLGSALGVALAGSAYFAWGQWLGVPPAEMAAAVIALILLACAAFALRLPDGIFDSAH
ncbi:MFS transporter [Novosphingobium cyanobacteriorum]|uniref:MFS transporter n=1 Tax=Novosphingobium cyanobacteriorum TaxID=3024215 RepID=A0ABT6CJT9_9SPHN|nr:MFS transporter [Novosphingobium cyanobacteriorum]MDF8333799.1 MFS transporter [Novosphingobium cyanobacteriorum]